MPIKNCEKIKLLPLTFPVESEGRNNFRFANISIFIVGSSSLFSHSLVFSRLLLVISADGVIMRSGNADILFGLGPVKAMKLGFLDIFIHGGKGWPVIGGFD